MAKINIVNAFTWLSNVLDTQNLTASEQLTLLHMLKFLNRNFWKPIKISTHMLARAIGKDDRTLKKSLDSLKSKDLIIELEGGYYIGIEGIGKQQRNNKRTDEGIGGENRRDENLPTATTDNDSRTDNGVGKVKTLADYL